MTLLAKRYASALFALTDAAGSSDAVAQDLAALHAEFSAPGTRALLTSPDIGTAERGVVLEKIGHGRDRLVQNLIGVLHHRRRLEVLFDIYPAFWALVLERKGEVEGVIESPFALAAEQLAEMTEVASALCGKKVTLTALERPELLGGARLRVGNVLYDGSMKAALKQLESKLMQASV